METSEKVVERLERADKVTARIIGKFIMAENVLDHINTGNMWDYIALIQKKLGCSEKDATSFFRWHIGLE